MFRVLTCIAIDIRAVFGPRFSAHHRTTSMLFRMTCGALDSLHRLWEEHPVTPDGEAEWVILGYAPGAIQVPLPHDVEGVVLTEGRTVMTVSQPYA